MQAFENKQNIRDRLVIAAMGLYAQHGLDGVSLRQIASAAGAKNSAAMQYHFGDKMGLLDAIMAYIHRHVQILWAQHSEQPATSVQQLVRNEISDWTTITRSYDWGANAVCFVSRLLLENSAELRAPVNRYYADHIQSLFRQLAQLFPTAPTRKLQLRLLIAVDGIVHGIAEGPSLAHSPFGDLTVMDAEERFDVLASYIEGGISHDL